MKMPVFVFYFELSSGLRVWRCSIKGSGRGRARSVVVQLRWVQMSIDDVVVKDDSVREDQGKVSVEKRARVNEDSAQV